MTNNIDATPYTTSTSSTIITSGGRSTRRKHQQQQCLLPGLPDHIAELCLSLVSPANLFSVCRSWRRLIYSPSFPPFLSIYALLLSTTTLTNQTHHSNSLEFSSFDPVSSKWYSLPPPPDPPLRLIRHHPSFICRNLPIQSVAVSGKLVLLAATTDHLLPALSRPLIFNPLAQKWTFGPPLATPRRWCAAGVARGAVYVASGIGSHYSAEVARSVEKWDLRSEINKRRSSSYCCQSEAKWEWVKLGGLRDGRLCREAIDAIGWRGKLCMVNVKGDAAKEGMVYDIERDTWEDMPEGMVAGWRGPAVTMEEETLYVVDETKGCLKMYDPARDVWVEILESERLRGAEHVAAGGGRVCVVCGGGFEIVVVDVAAAPPRLWSVDLPPGFHALAVHVLPRMI